ncbi:hypothetical protein E2320_009934 [Naja naja]|nr:hypothetical protein E2320_009934 [Naja naja]
MLPVLLCLLVSSAVLLADPVPHASFKLGTEEVTWSTLSIWTSQPSTVSIHCPVARPVCSMNWSGPRDGIPCARPPLIANGEYDPDSSDMYDVGWVTIYRCDRDYSLIGSSTITCIVAENGVDGTWDLPAPKCKRITCARPPVISNGIYDPNPSDVYDAGWVVIYRCDPDYSLIGNSTITCIVAENGVVGKWDLPSPECKKVKCRRPSIPNGNVASVFQATYTYQNNLQIECNPGYTLLGSSSIQCGADSQWKPSLPSCDKIPTTPKPTKSPPAVPSTPSIFPWPGIVSTKEDGTEKWGKTQGTMRHEMQNSNPSSFLQSFDVFADMFSPHNTVGVILESKRIRKLQDCFAIQNISIPELKQNCHLDLIYWETVQHVKNGAFYSSRLASSGSQEANERIETTNIILLCCFEHIAVLPYSDVHSSSCSCGEFRCSFLLFKSSLPMWVWLFLPPLFWLPEVQGHKMNKVTGHDGCMHWPLSASSQGMRHFHSSLASGWVCGP